MTAQGKPLHKHRDPTKVKQFAIALLEHQGECVEILDGCIHCPLKYSDVECFDHTVVYQKTLLWAKDNIGPDELLEAML